MGRRVKTVKHHLAIQRRKHGLVQRKAIPEGGRGGNRRALSVSKERKEGGHTLSCGGGDPNQSRKKRGTRRGFRVPLVEEKGEKGDSTFRHWGGTPASPSLKERGESQKTR